MLGAAGALICMTAGTAVGCWLKERRLYRFRMLQAQCDAVSGMRLMLEQERLPIPALLTSSAACVGSGMGAQELSRRLMLTSENMVRKPLTAPAEAYEQACAQIPAPWEHPEEQQIMSQLFHQLGKGTASMREQAASACLRKLKPLLEAAQTEAETGGRLCMQLGILLGLMAGIVLW